MALAATANPCRLVFDCRRDVPAGFGFGMTIRFTNCYTPDPNWDYLLPLAYRPLERNLGGVFD